MARHQHVCQQQQDVYSLLVQVEKLQVALRNVTAERDALAAQLVDSSETQQEGLQALLDGREQLLMFQTDLLLVRDNNEQLLNDNNRLQEYVKQLQQQLQQSDRALHQLQQQQEQWLQQRTGVGLSPADLQLLAPSLVSLLPANLQLLAPSLLNSSRTSDVHDSASSTDTASSSADLHLAGAQQQQEQQDQPPSLCKLQQQLQELHAQQQQQQQQPNPTTHMHSAQAQQPRQALAAFAQHQEQQQAQLAASGLQLMPDEHGKLLNVTGEVAAAASTAGSRPPATCAEVSPHAAGALAAAAGGVVCLTQQDLENILTEVEHLQQRLAAVAHSTSLSSVPQQQQQQQQQQQHHMPPLQMSVQQQQHIPTPQQPLSPVHAPAQQREGYLLAGGPEGASRSSTGNARAADSCMELDHNQQQQQQQHRHALAASQHVASSSVQLEEQPAPHSPASEQQQNFVCQSAAVPLPAAEDRAQLIAAYASGSGASSTVTHGISQPAAQFTCRTAHLPQQRQPKLNATSSQASSKPPWNYQRQQQQPQQLQQQPHMQQQRHTAQRPKGQQVELQHQPHSGQQPHQHAEVQPLLVLQAVRNSSTAAAAAAAGCAATRPAVAAASTSTPGIGFSGSWIPDTSSSSSSSMLLRACGDSNSSGFSNLARDVRYMQPVSVRGPRLLQPSAAVSNTYM